MRPIDADALMPNAKYKGKYDILTAYDVVAAPTIDAVPVVRCREFIHRKKYQDDEQQGDTICTLEWKMKKLDWYCADGQRREDGDGDG